MGNSRLWVNILEDILGIILPILLEVVNITLAILMLVRDTNTEDLPHRSSTIRIHEQHKDRSLPLHK
jgi:hypothetical protein